MVLGLLVPLVLLECKARLDLKVHLAILGIQEPLELQGLLDLLVL